MVAENYLWHEAHGFDSRTTWTELIALCGDDARSTRGCAAARRCGSDDWRVEVLHLPGHTLGHIGVWDPRSRAAIVIDAVLERGIYSNDGALLIPPRVYDLDAYRGHDPPDARARARAAAHRALPGHGRRRGPRVPRALARVHRTRSSRRSATELAAGTEGSGR